MKKTIILFLLMVITIVAFSQGGGSGRHPKIDTPRIWSTTFTEEQATKLYTILEIGKSRIDRLEMPLLIRDSFRDYVDSLQKEMNKIHALWYPPKPLVPDQNDSTKKSK